MDEDSARNRPSHLPRDVKVREVGLRRIALRRGLRLERCRRRDPAAIGFGLYRLVDADSRPGTGGPYTMTLEEAAKELGEDDRGAAAA